MNDSPQATRLLYAAALAVSACGVAGVLVTGGAFDFLAVEFDREVNPGRTVAPSAPPGAAAPDDAVPTDASVVPDTPPADVEACPPPGFRMTVGPGDGWKSLRTLSVRLTNCGKQPYTVKGYPSVRMLDDDRDPLPVKVLDGTQKIAGTGVASAGPKGPIAVGTTAELGVSAWSRPGG